MAHSFEINPSPSELAVAGSLDNPEIRQARVDLAACFRMAAKLGMAEGICNHFSFVLPGHPQLFLVNPFGLSFSEITASSLLICDFEGRVVAGKGKPEATAFFIHAQLHRLNPRATAAFHTHMPNATALCMLEGEPFVWAGQTALKFYDRLVVDENYNGLALDYDEGERISRAAGDADIVMQHIAGVGRQAAAQHKAQRQIVERRFGQRRRQVQHRRRAGAPAQGAGPRRGVARWRPATPWLEPRPGFYAGRPA